MASAKRENQDIPVLLVCSILSDKGIA